jgi:hypothetical protein
MQQAVFGVAQSNALGSAQQQQQQQQQQDENTCDNAAQV